VFIWKYVNFIQYGLGCQRTSPGPPNCSKKQRRASSYGSKFRTDHCLQSAPLHTSQSRLRVPGARELEDDPPRWFSLLWFQLLSAEASRSGKLTILTHESPKGCKMAWQWPTGTKGLGNSKFKLFLMQHLTDTVRYGPKEPVHPSAVDCSTSADQKFYTDLRCARWICSGNFNPLIFGLKTFHNHPRLKVVT
jgi:hypothetical protein